MASNAAWRAQRMDYGRGRWAAFHPRGYWSIPARYGLRAAMAEANRRNKADAGEGRA